MRYHDAGNNPGQLPGTAPNQDAGNTGNAAAPPTVRPAARSANPVITPTVVLVILALALIVLGTNSMGNIAAVPRFEIGRLAPPEPINEQIRPSDPAAAQPRDTGSAANEDSMLPIVVMIAAALIVLAGLSAAAHAVVRTRYSERNRPLEDENPDGEIVASVMEADVSQFRQHFDDAEAALLDAEATDDVMIRCWLSLEQAASLAGSGRRVNQTPSEFTASVLQAFDTNPDDTAAVLRLYQRARYGGGRPQAAMKPEELARAQSAVSSLRRDIEAHLPQSRSR
ncbi:DUF4129 domain-containing protein [Arthrobacter pigmenti]